MNATSDVTVWKDCETQATSSMPSTVRVIKIDPRAQTVDYVLLQIDQEYGINLPRTDDMQEMMEGVGVTSRCVSAPGNRDRVLCASRHSHVDEAFEIDGLETRYGQPYDAPLCGIRLWMHVLVVTPPEEDTHMLTAYVDVPEDDVTWIREHIRWY